MIRSSTTKGLTESCGVKLNSSEDVLIDEQRHYADGIPA